MPSTACRATTPILRSALLGFGIGAALVAPELAGQLLGMDHLSWNFIPLIVPVLLLSSAGACVVLVHTLFVRDAPAWRRLVLWLILAVTVFSGLLAVWPVRRFAFQRLAERSAPLVAAIERYESEQGAPPAALEALVPDYLDRVPGTGMLGYPEYEYEVLWKPEQEPSSRKPKWELRVFCHFGGINFDTFFFWPTREYPPSLGPEPLERIGDWVYLHE